MPKSIPKYRHHKGSGQAVVTLNRRDLYLGKYGSPDSHKRYAEAISDWQTQQESAPTDVTVKQLTSLYLSHCRQHYRKNSRKNSRETSEVQTIRNALKRLNGTYRNLLAGEFSPRMLKSVRQSMIDADLARTTINGAIARIRRMFRWAVAEELVRPEVLVALKGVPDLRQGRSRAREPEPVTPIPAEDINAVLQHVSRQVKDMIRVQLLSGCRPEEIVSLRPGDIDRSGEVWEAVISDHKTSHHGRERRLYFGPKAQAILIPYIDNRPADLPCFSPTEAERERRRKQREARKTPVQPSQKSRRAIGARRRPKEKYSVASYRRSIHRGCEAAEVNRWSPNRLRHSRATELRKIYGIEAAKTVCGHSRLETTLVYAEADFA